MNNPGSAELETLQARLRYRFEDPELLLRSLTHRSSGSQNNERLEFLGDTVVNLAAAAAFYDRFPDASEGILSRLRASVVSGKSLAGIARGLNLSECLVLGESERKSGGRHRGSILADALEALAGAILLDSNLETAVATVRRWLRDAIEGATPEETIDAKTQLQEWLQARRDNLPVYSIVEVTGSGHEQCFRVECRLAARKLKSEGSGSSRRRAEQQAAQRMLEQLVAR